VLSIVEENWAKLNKSSLCNVFIKKPKWILSVEFLKRSGHMNEYFCVSMNLKDVCLICRHYNSKHKENYKNCVGDLRREKVSALKRGLESQQNIFRKRSNDDGSSALRTSYRVAHSLAKESKLSSDGEFVRKCLQRVVQEIFPEKETVLIL
jgi:hypothetical protein